MKEKNMRKIDFLFVIPALMLVLSGCNTQSGRVDPGERSPAATDADNTARNERDRNTATQTSGDQAENEADREISASIRRAVVKDDSLSMNAHNVKIITSNGVVTLRGPVKSETERAAVEARAKQVAGVQSVNNQLEVEANR
jgi:hyperosmotically inducible periplasmic protein